MTPEDQMTTEDQIVASSLVETADFSGLPWDLNDQSQERELRTMLEDWKEFDKAIHSKYWPEWNESDNRLNGDVVPSGFTTDYSGKLAENNDPRNRPNDAKEFVTVNRSRPNHESVMGDFATTRRKLVIGGREPRYRNIAKVYQERVKYVEDDEMLPEMVYFPAMDNAWAKGTTFIKVNYDPNANDLRGKFEIEEVNIRDVMVDGNTRSAYYSKARRITQRMSYTKQEASVKFGHLPLYDETRWAADNEYDEPYDRFTDGNSYYNNRATFYEFQFVWPSPAYYLGMPSTGEVERISYQEYLFYSTQPEFKDYVFFGGNQDTHFIALYNATMGVFHLQESAIDMYTLIPLLNIQSDSRLYGIGDVKNYGELQDLLNVLVSVFLDNAKRSNIPIIPMEVEAYNEHQQAIQDAIEHGGAAPGATNVFYAKPINEALAMLIPWTIGWIQDVTSKHSASMGEMPSKQVAKETIQTLIAKDRQSHGRKDVMLRYTLTRLAQCMVKFIRVMDDQPGWFQAVDPRPGQPKYIPINQKWTEQEYMFNLAELFELPPPASEEERMIYFQMLQKVRKKFEEDNDVRSHSVPGIVVNGQEFTPEKTRMLLDKSMMSLEELSGVYQVVPSKITVYDINDLTQDANLKIVYGVDDDYENDKQFKANRALMLNERQSMSRLDMLREMGIQNPEQLIENVDAEIQALNIAKALAAAGPEVQQYVVSLLQNPEVVQGMMKGMQGVSERRRGTGESKGGPQKKELAPAAA